MKKLEKVEMNELEMPADVKLCAIFSKRLRDEMYIKKIDQAKLAEMAKCSTASISDYLKEKTEPRIQILFNIAEVLNVNADYLLGRTNVKSRNMDYLKISEKTGLVDPAIDRLIAIKKWCEESNDKKTLNAVNELLANPASKYFFGTLGDYLYGEEFIDTIEFTFASLDRKDETIVKTKKNLSRKFSTANLMELQEMLVTVKNSLKKGE